MSRAAALLTLVLLVLLLPACPPAVDERIYRYEDDRGRVAFVTGLERVPSPYRETARVVSGAADEGGPADAGPEPGAPPDVADHSVIYRYPGPGGRPVFTNRRDFVPAERRARVQVVDLSRVSTNPELGRDLDAALDRELERLAESKPCREARAEVRVGRWGLLWRDQRHVVVVAGMLAALLLTAPWAVRRLGAPWIRVLTFAIPALLLTGVLAHGLITVNRSLSEGARMSQLCKPDEAERGGVAAAPVAVDPAARLRARVEHADQLRAAIEAALAGPEARIQEELAH